MAVGKVFQNRAGTHGVSHGSHGEKEVPEQHLLGHIGQTAMQRCSEALENVPELLEYNRLELVWFSLEAPHQAHEMLTPMRRIEPQAQCRGNKSVKAALQLRSPLAGSPLAGVEPIQALLVEWPYAGGRAGEVTAP